MSNKTVVVTGCSSGIGRCAAEELHNRGYNVIATVRRVEHAERLHALGIKQVIELDLSSSESVNAASSEILELGKGDIYGLFNNAAYGQPGAVEDLSRHALRCQFETNFFGTHELTINLLPAMLNRGDARIVQNSSVLGFAAMPMRGAYNASKFALEGLSDTLRLELAGTGVKVSIIEPGPILSNFRKNALFALEREINMDTSRHGDKYRSALERLKKDGPAAPFTLPPQAVVKKLIHALESRRPRQRYRVTFPTQLMAVLKTILPGSIMDSVLIKAGK